MIDVLKIVYYDETGGVGTLAFNNMEARLMRIRTTQDYHIHKLQNKKPILYFTSDEYKIFYINIKTSFQETITKLEILRQQKGFLRLFWDFRNDKGEAETVKLYSNISSIFFAGIQAANQEIPITFYQVQPSIDYVSVVSDYDYIGG